MRHAALGGVHAGAAQLLLCYILARHGFHHFRAGEEHVARAFGHDIEIGQRRGVHRSAGTRAEYRRYLWNDARRQDVALENFGISREGVHAFLNAGAARVVYPDYRRADLHRLIHNLANFHRKTLRQRAAEHREVLCKHIHQAAFDGAVPGNHAVAQHDVFFHVEVRTAMCHKHVKFLKAAAVEQHGDAFARRIFPFLVLCINTLLSAAQPRFLAQLD